MGVYYALEYRNTAAMSVDKNDAATVLASVLQEGATPTISRAEVEVTVNDDLKNLDVSHMVLFTHAAYWGGDEDLFELTADELRAAAKEMRETAETTDDENDKNELTHVAEVLEDALSTYKDEGAVYTFRLLG